MHKLLSQWNCSTAHFDHNTRASIRGATCLAE